MPWVRFDRKYSWPIPGKRGRATIAFKPGRRMVTTQCARDAIAAGAASRIRSPRAAAPAPLYSVDSGAASELETRRFGAAPASPAESLAGGSD